MDSGFRLDVSGTQTADDKMLKPGGWRELPLAFGSACVTLHRAADYSKSFSRGRGGTVTINKQLWILFKKSTVPASGLAHQINEWLGEIQITALRDRWGKAG